MRWHPSEVRLTLQYFDECPNYRDALGMLDELRGELGIEAPVDMVEVESDEQAEGLGFRGSPTVLIDDVDPFFDPSAPIGLSCRLYRDEHGLTSVPPRRLLRQALEQSMRSASS